MNNQVQFDEILLLNQPILSKNNKQFLLLKQISLHFTTTKPKQSTLYL